MNGFAFGGTNGALVAAAVRGMTGGAWTTLDRIVRVTDDEAEAIRNVPNTLAIFDSHFPRFPVLPGVLILGSLGTLCAELLRQRDRAEPGGSPAPSGSASATSCSPATSSSSPSR